MSRTKVPTSPLYKSLGARSQCEDCKGERPALGWYVLELYAPTKGGAMRQIETLCLCRKCALKRARL